MAVDVFPEVPKELRARIYHGIYDALYDILDKNIPLSDDFTDIDEAEDYVANFLYDIRNDRDLQSSLIDMVEEVLESMILKDVRRRK